MLYSCALTSVWMYKQRVCGIIHLIILTVNIVFILQNSQLHLFSESWTLQNFMCLSLKIYFLRAERSCSATNWSVCSSKVQWSLNFPHCSTHFSLLNKGRSGEQHSLQSFQLDFRARLQRGLRWAARVSLRKLSHWWMVMDGYEACFHCRNFRVP